MRRDFILCLVFLLLVSLPSLARGQQPVLPLQPDRNPARLATPPTPEKKAEVASARQAEVPLQPDRNPARFVTPPAPEKKAEAGAQQAQLPPEPDRNPSRIAGPPVPEKKAEAPATAPATEEPPLPGDQPTLPWLTSKVAAARADCDKRLANVTLDYVALPAIKHGVCGAPAPILVRSIGSYPEVVIDPPAIVNCTLAATLYAWLKDKVQPEAMAKLGSAVVKLHNAASYDCRNRYGATNTKLSEHALANALDISEFVLASGEHVTVLGNWHRVTAAPPAPDSNPRVVAAVAPPAATGSVIPVSNTRQAGSNAPRVTKAEAEPGAPPLPPPVAKARPPKATSERRAAFLHAVHDEACQEFDTVLGPNTNEAHRSHFHLDMKVRRYVKICE
jgi:hypothetical protein